MTKNATKNPAIAAVMGTTGVLIAVEDVLEAVVGRLYSNTHLRLS